MDGYECAYRDPKSPLTPLLPMHSSFNIETIKSKLNYEKKSSPCKMIRSTCKRNLENQLSQVAIEKQLSPLQLKSHAIEKDKENVKPKLNDNKKSLNIISNKLLPKNNGRKDTPIPSNKIFTQSYAKVSHILKAIGMSKYIELFRCEEIDYMVFKMLTYDDLLEIGIDDHNDCKCIINAVNYYKRKLN